MVPAVAPSHFYFPPQGLLSPQQSLQGCTLPRGRLPGSGTAPFVIPIQSLLVSTFTHIYTHGSFLKRRYFKQLGGALEDVAVPKAFFVRSNISLKVYPVISVLKPNQTDSKAWEQTSPVCLSSVSEQKQQTLVSQMRRLKLWVVKFENCTNQSKHYCSCRDSVLHLW